MMTAVSVPAYDRKLFDNDNQVKEHSAKSWRNFHFLLLLRREGLTA